MRRRGRRATRGGIRLPILLPILAVVCLIGVILAKDFALARLARQASAKPFVIESRSTTFLGSDLTHPTVEYYFFNAVRSDGSQARGNIAINSDGSWRVLFRTVKRVTENRNVIAADALQLKSTTVLTQNGLTRLLAPWEQAHGCTMPGYKYVGDGTVMGYHIMKFDRDYSSGHWQEWEAPDLACHSLWGEMQLKNADGSINVTTFHTTVSVREGEPPTALFDIPSAYSEVSPSQIVHAGMAQRAPTMPGAQATPAQRGLDNKLSKLDQFYDSHRVQ